MRQLRVPGGGKCNILAGVMTHTDEPMQQSPALLSHLGQSICQVLRHELFRILELDELIAPMPSEVDLQDVGNCEVSTTNLTQRLMAC